MTDTDDVADDEGGEAPCLAHLLDDPPALPDERLAQLVTDLTVALAIAVSSAARRVPIDLSSRPAGQRLDRPGCRSEAVSAGPDADPDGTW
jgi:hypothetical protein